MKKVAIFDDCYDTSDKLGKEVNEWIEQYDINVISIDVKTINEEEYIKDDFDDKLEPMKIIEKAIYWYAVIIYEE